MTNRPGIKEALWMAAGAAVLLAVVVAVLALRDDRSPAQRLAARTERANLVEAMQLALTSASEAEKSAVLAVTDESSQEFADKSRAATAAAERQRGDLAARLAKDGTAAERDLLAKLTASFAEFRHVDDEVLVLAVKNTNLKASALAFGPAADAVRGMSAALDRLVASHGESLNAKQVNLLGCRAQIAALRIETLIAPHIAEESDRRMDELEAAMRTDDDSVHRDLAALAALPAVGGDSDLATAAARYATFGELRTRIVALSRENTNVRSLALSLNQSRRAMLVCTVDLAALQEAVLAEPVPGVTDGGPVSPR